MKKAEKIFFVENLTKELETASLVLLVDYTGLTVKKQQDLKKMLKEVGASMIVAKNTLFQIAGKNAKLDEEILTDTVLKGPMALVLSETDPISPLQIIAKFASANELPHFKVGIVDKKYFDNQSLIKLSQLPSKEVLYGQVVGGISAPLYGLVSTLQGNLQKLVWILKSKSGM